LGHRIPIPGQGIVFRGPDVHTAPLQRKRRFQLRRVPLGHHKINSRKTLCPLPPPNHERIDAPLRGSYAHPKSAVEVSSRVGQGIDPALLALHDQYTESLIISDGINGTINRNLPL
jgi:hypothetical protein